MIILYDFGGHLATLPAMQSFKELFSGTEEDRLIHIANAELPDGTKFEVSPWSDPVDIEDRTIGNDWKYISTGRERISVALSEAAKTEFNAIRQAWFDRDRDGSPI